MNTQTDVVFLNKELSKKLVLFTFLLAIFMGALDHGIVGPAFSSINSHFDITASWGVWSFTIYTLFFAVSIPVMGKLSDRFGRKVIFTNGIILFATGSIVSAFAPNFTVFLLGRAIQAIGTGGIFPITAAQIAATYPPDVRGKYLGYIGMVFGLGSILGPVAGGTIIGSLPWQWIFLINIPISIIILLFLTRITIEQQVTEKSIDYKGIFGLTITILSLMLGITIENIYFLAFGIVTSLLMIIIEKKAVDPVLNLQYFKNKNTLFIMVLSLTSGFVMATAINLIPLFSETVLGLKKGESGIGVTPLAIASMIASLIGGILVDKIGANRVLGLGFVITLTGALSLALLVNNLLMFIITILVLGFGIGIVIGAPLNVMIMQNISVQETGSAVGYVSLFRSLGSTLGPTIAGIMLTLYENDFSYIYVLSAALSFLSLILIFTLKNRRL